VLPLRVLRQHAGCYESKFATLLRLKPTALNPSFPFAAQPLHQHRVFLLIEMTRPNAPKVFSTQRSDYGKKMRTTQSGSHQGVDDAAVRTGACHDVAEDRSLVTNRW